MHETRIGCRITSLSSRPRPQLPAYLCRRFQIFADHMASSAATCDVQRPNPRSRATPRRLNYSKCEQCRDPKIKAKVSRPISYYCAIIYSTQQCEPQSREWPGERCQNCIKRGFPCSAPQRTRKGGRRLKAPTAAALKSTAAKTPRTLGNTSSQETVHQVYVPLHLTTTPLTCASDLFS